MIPGQKDLNYYFKKLSMRSITNEIPYRSIKVYAKRQGLSYLPNALKLKQLNMLHSGIKKNANKSHKKSIGEE